MTVIPPSEFPRPVRAEQVPNPGLELDIVADPTERAALAHRFGIVAVESLTAHLRLKPFRSGEVIRLTGKLSADVVQTCVVTLEAVPGHVEEEIDMTFGHAPSAEDDEADLELSFEDEDPPDPIVGGIIDVGEAVAEHLALALDPFPRKPGASVPEAPEPAPDEDAKPNPFAVLARLRQKKE
ncbi:MAG: YceD family protein [Solirubrobacterales bacterium]